MSNLPRSHDSPKTSQNCTDKLPTQEVSELLLPESTRKSLWTIFIPWAGSTKIIKWIVKREVAMGWSLMMIKIKIPHHPKWTTLKRGVYIQKKNLFITFMLSHEITECYHLERPLLEISKRTNYDAPWKCRSPSFTPHHGLLDTKLSISI